MGKLQRKASWTKSDVYHFETAINEIVEATAQRIAPLHYQFGGFLFAVCLLIAATIVVAQTDETLEDYSCLFWELLLGALVFGIELNLWTENGSELLLN